MLITVLVTMPVCNAMHAGHSRVVELLAACNADLNKATTDVGATPLNMAAAYGHTDTAFVSLSSLSLSLSVCVCMISLSLSLLCVCVCVCVCV